MVDEVDGIEFIDGLVALILGGLQFMLEVLFLLLICGGVDKLFNFQAFLGVGTNLLLMDLPLVLC